MSAPSPTEPSVPAKPAAPWFSPRRFRFWAAVALLVYTLSGFLLAPMLVKKLAVDGVRDALGRELSIAAVRINPFVLSADVEGVALHEPDGATLFALDRFHANFQLSSLMRWAWTFRDLRFEGPYVLYERFADGDDRLTRLLADAERLNPSVEDTDEDAGGLPRLLIGNLVLTGGRAELRDHVPADPVELAPGPVNISVNELNTLPDREGRQSVEIRLAGDARITWQGSLSLAPLESSGRLTLENVPLDEARAYLEEFIDLEDFAARLSVRTDYRIETGADGAISVALSALESDLEDVSVTGFEPAEPLLAIATLSTRDGELRWPEGLLRVGTVDVAGLDTGLQLDASGQPRLLQLLQAPSVDDPAAATGDDAAPAWRIEAARATIDAARVALEDRGVSPPARLGVAALDITLMGIDNASGTAMPVTVAASFEGGGALGLEGDLVVLPAPTFSGRARIDDLPLGIAQTYLQEVLAVALQAGALGAEFDLALAGSGAVTAAGRLQVEGLEVTDTIENQPLLSWTRLNVDRFEADTAAARVDLSLIELLEPFGRVQVRADRSTNLGGLVVERATGTEPNPATEDSAAKTWAFTIARIDFENGGMDFSDLSLPLPFAVRIGQLDGAVTAIDSESTEAAGIGLEGQVGDYGLARINGRLRVFDPLASTDITMAFRNLLMSDLSPYSIEFAGRRIDEGKLDLDLEYVIDDSRLTGRNDIVVSDLVLGEKVESPNAVSLPLDLAVALLKDGDGVIDIDLPVEGDVGDPEFKLGGVIWKAFTGLITKIVTAPFALLGNLVGGDSDDLGAIEFLAGRADLTPPEREKVARLVEALAQRPQLAIEIAGVYDPVVDAPVLQFEALRQQVVQRLGGDTAELGRTRADDLLAAEFGDVLEDLHRERFPDLALETIREAHSKPPADDPDGEAVVDELAYAADLRDRLLASVPIGTTELEALAGARAAALREAFTAAAGIPPERLQAAAPRAVESDDGEWVVLELGVAVP